MHSLHSAHLAAFNSQNQILLIKRKDIPVWVIPGGTAEKGESPLQTAIREFSEETGVKLSPNEVKLVAKYSPTHKNKRYKYLFVTNKKKLTGLTTTSESSAFGFFSIANLPEITSLYEQRKIHEAFLANCNTILVRTDTIFYSSEIMALLKHPIQLLKLVYLYLKSNSI